MYMRQKKPSNKIAEGLLALFLAFAVVQCSQNDITKEGINEIARNNAGANKKFIEIEMGEQGNAY